MKRYKFVEHSGTTCPVDPETMVVYRTTSVATPVSHIHHPVKAGELNWDENEQYMGSILDYAIAKVIKPFKTHVKTNIDSHVDGIDTFDAHR